MSAFKPFLAGALAGAAILYGSLQYHVVRSKDGFYIVPRAPQASLGLAYADLRGMSAAELERRPELARAMAADSARQLLADKGESKAEKSLIDSAAARDRLNATIDEWDTNAVPKPRNSTIDAPIWNPFADEKSIDPEPAAPEFPKSTSGSDDGGMFGPDELPDAELWPSDSASRTNAIPSAFDSEIEFDPYVENSEDDTAFLDIARELDKARTLTDSRARKFGGGDGTHTAAPDNPFGTDVDLTSASSGNSAGRTHTTNHAVVPKQSPGALPSDENQNLRNAVTRRARQIYERTRRHSSSAVGGVVRRGTSKANSAIDELISPFDNLPSEFDRKADSNISSPKRYSRRAR